MKCIILRATHKDSSERYIKNSSEASEKPVSKSITTSRNQEEGEDSSDENYRPENEVLNPYPSQTDCYDSEYESTVDSVINYNIN